MYLRAGKDSFVVLALQVVYTLVAMRHRLFIGYIDTKRRKKPV
jgi:hypothetical protein